MSATQAHNCLMERFEDLQSLSAPALPALDTLLTSAGSTPTLTTQNNDIHSNSSERALQAAFCLATPPDNPADDNTILGQQPLASSARATATAAMTHSSSTSSNNNSSNSTQAARSTETTTPGASSGSSRGLPSRTPSSRNLLARGVEEASQLEVAACQHAAVDPSSSLEEQLLRASGAVARLRRRKLLRLLRNTQDAGQDLLAALQQSDAGTLFSSIGSSFASLMSLEAAGDDEDDYDGRALQIFNSGSRIKGSSGGVEGWIADDSSSSNSSNDNEFLALVEGIHATGNNNNTSNAGSPFSSCSSCRFGCYPSCAFSV